MYLFYFTADQTNTRLKFKLTIGSFFNNCIKILQKIIWSIVLVLKVLIFKKLVRFSLVYEPNVLITILLSRKHNNNIRKVVIDKLDIFDPEKLRDSPRLLRT